MKATVKIEKMTQTVKIEKINYFGASTGTSDFNAKMTYFKGGKMYLAHIFVDFFNKRISEGRNNPKEHKVLRGVLEAANEYASKQNWMI